jgi:hypothetical protein
MKKMEFSSIIIEPDFEINNSFGHYTDEQLQEFLYLFVKGCKRFNMHKTIQVIAFAYDLQEGR